MRMMMIALAAVLLAAPLAAQPGEPAVADAWMRMPIPDARLRVEFASVAESGAAEWAARSSVQWMLIGGAVGCAAGALIMASGADEGEKAATAFNGCILGGSAGVFLGGVYGLLTGG